MGIVGLTTFISNHSEHYHANYALHDTYLVIDGNSIACQLYMWHAKCNSIFGGDYDKYAQCVSDFFDELLMCNVIPLVLIDGGCENKKLKTVISRTKDKIEMASRYTLHFQQRAKFFPLLMKEVFKDVMNEKGIKYTQCIFEADNTIATIARGLNCPVLSYDSDFYIYGSLYIPFDTWGNGVVPNPTGSGSMKYCKIYNVEKLFRAYNGLNQTLLPLAAILLGNDYVKQHTFRNFFRHLKLPRIGRKKFNEQQRRIDATFNWLRKLSLNQAVIGILSRLRRQERKRVLNIIETMINGSYMTRVPQSILHILGILTQKFLKAQLLNISKTYKFEGDIYNLTYIDERTNETESSNDDDEIEDKEIVSVLAGRETVSCPEFEIRNLPKWFISEFKLGRYPSYFIDIIMRKLYVCPTQIEDHSYASSVNASLNIISVIYELLMSERPYLTGLMSRQATSMDYMEYLTRYKDTIKCFRLTYDRQLISFEHSRFINFRTLPILARKEILDDTFKITYTDKSCIYKIPPNWKLYIATMKYWINQEEESFKLNCHIYSLLFTILYNIIDNKIGFHRILHKFHHRYDKLVKEIQNTRKVQNYQPKYSDKTTLINALQEVNVDDCWIAASFFVSNFETNQKLYLQPKKFNITIVHNFAVFQNCLRHGMHLNALLEYPYEQTKVASVFNGTLLYNLCSNFKKRDNVEEYINTVLQNSPSLLRLFNILLSTVKPLFGTLLEKKVNKSKKRKARRDEKKEERDTTQEDHDEEEEAETTHESSSEEVFHDVNNPFSILGATQN
ncbi:protein asteroid-like [Linepithema humile]|uniref:protein asteroid-like n=1 Tax=Linepithema humile TaxID=83485 RepID=UPI00351E56E3